MEFLEEVPLIKKKYCFSMNIPNLDGISASGGQHTALTSFLNLGRIP
jgi:hypothetical protein